MEKKQFGSLYINKRPVVPAGRQFDRYRETPVLELGGTKPGKEIEWLTVGHLLIATRVLIHSISWEDLDQRGLISGQEAVIDSKRYKVRTPSVKEWDEAAAMCVGHIQDLWYFQDGWSWCIEESTLDNRLRYLCSGNNTHSPMTCSAKTRSKPFGWRRYWSQFRLDPTISRQCSVQWSPWRTTALWWLECLPAFPTMTWSSAGLSLTGRARIAMILLKESRMGLSL